METTTTPDHLFVDLEVEAILREIDLAIEAYDRSIARGLELAREMREVADALEAHVLDATAELQEWVA